MNRKEFLWLPISSILIGLHLGCQDEDKPNLPNQFSTITIKKVIPEVAMAGGTLLVQWQSQHESKLTIWMKVGEEDWQIKAEGVDANLGEFLIGLPTTLKNQDHLSLKLSGESAFAIKENIISKNLITSAKQIQIRKIVPNSAIASEKLRVYFIAQTIQPLLVELKSNKGTTYVSQVIDSSEGCVDLNLPSSFESKELLSLILSGEGLETRLVNIPAYNTFSFKASTFPEITALGGFAKLRIQSDEVWLKRISENEIQAFSGKCTHAGCPIDYQKSERQFYCSCHGSRFSEDGKVVNGPADLPLVNINCEYLGEDSFRLIYQ